MTPAERAAFYSEAFPKYPALRSDDRWIDGMWVIGNSYGGTGYYGAYPGNYLKRVMSLFPDKESVLHLFSGSLPPGDYIRFDVDLTLDAEVHGYAKDLHKKVGRNRFDLVIVDPPYSKEHAARYGSKMINRKTVVSECAKVLAPGGHLVWLDTMLPMFRKDELYWCGAIGVCVSTNHLIRGCFIFKKANQGADAGTAEGHGKGGEDV